MNRTDEARVRTVRAEVAEIIDGQETRSRLSDGSFGEQVAVALDQLGLLRTDPLQGGFDDDGDVAFVIGTHNPTTAYEWLLVTEGTDAVAPIVIEHGDRCYARITVVDGQPVHEFCDERDADEGYVLPAIFWGLP